MSKFWSWYDALEKKDPSLRFMIFLAAILTLYLLIPIWVGVIFGMQYVLPTSYAGVVIMAVLAVSKVCRWPK